MIIKIENMFIKKLMMWQKIPKTRIKKLGKKTQKTQKNNNKIYKMATPLNLKIFKLSKLGDRNQCIKIDNVLELLLRPNMIKIWPK